ncbi:54S ribosomal protein, mitochondrial [Lachnellula hyalina]|uniref:Large ribosomal subunit protein uL23m n=1 Tax=Lachnellula hyalina TaxID=1316788 RepID=A0A8H8TZT2_9HELO|nr:54S ribosomal protein, mitochondrial [Lachnellula hyalina]TVY25331.1 54S ribosomal protein, mitochondrial [Lachnellula hyalina]
MSAPQVATTAATAVAPVVRSVVRKSPQGKKQVFLPNFTLTLLRTPNLPPTFASFIVPLNLNKLDLRDYMWNVYGVPVRGVRSYIQQQKLRQDKPGAKRPAPRRWFRPRSIKKMMIEMEQPFVWPEEPTNFDEWDKDTHDAAKKEREATEATFRPDIREKPTAERKSIAEQAKALLRGEDTWTPAASQWEDDGEAVEVEKDVKI